MSTASVAFVCFALPYLQTLVSIGPDVRAESRQIIYESLLTSPPRRVVILTQSRIGTRTTLCTSRKSDTCKDFSTVVMGDVILLAQFEPGSPPVRMSVGSVSKPSEESRALADAFRVAAKHRSLKLWLDQDVSVSSMRMGKGFLVAFNKLRGSPGDGQVAEVRDGKVVDIVSV